MHADPDTPGTFPPPDPATFAGPGSTNRDSSVAVAFVASVGITALVGAASGLAWGGVGGRIAMRVVFLTSSEGVRGLTSDDGFEIGTISGATVFLLIFTMVLGGIAGLVVGVLRMITAGPTWVVALGTGVATAAFGGAAIVHTDGVDFRFLDPLWLTIGLFVLIPGLWGASVIVATDRLVRSDHLDDLPDHIRRPYWGATGWIVLAAVTILGTRNLVADITALT